MAKGTTHKKVRAIRQPHKSLPSFCPASDCSSSICSILRVHVWALGIRCARLFNFCLQQPCYMLEAEANIRIPDCTGWCIPQSPMHWVASSPIIINQQGFEHCSSDSNSLKYNLTALRNLDLCTAVPSRSLLVFRFTGLGRWCSSLLIGYSSWIFGYKGSRRWAPISFHPG